MSLPRRRSERQSEDLHSIENDKKRERRGGGGERKDQIFTPKPRHSMPEHLKQHILQREWENVKTGGYLEANSTWCTHAACVDVLMLCA